MVLSKHTYTKHQKKEKWEDKSNEKKLFLETNKKNSNKLSRVSRLCEMN